MEEDRIPVYRGRDAERIFCYTNPEGLFDLTEKETASRILDDYRNGNLWKLWIQGGVKTIGRLWAGVKKDDPSLDYSGKIIGH